MIGSLLGVDDGIWQGNFDLADILFLVAAFLFGAAAIIPITRRGNNRIDFSVSLIPAGLCLVAIALLVL